MLHFDKGGYKCNRPLLYICNITFTDVKHSNKTIYKCKQQFTFVNKTTRWGLQM